MKQKNLAILLISVCLTVCFLSINQSEAKNIIGKKELLLSAGSEVPVNELEAVGTTEIGCTATLITQDLVLTAAHCVCSKDKNGNLIKDKNGNHVLNSKESFTLHNVFPVNNPYTVIDESKTTKNITIPGSAILHPEFEKAGWGRKDFALIHLNTPVYKLAKNVRPIPVEEPFNVPQKSEKITLVGLGPTGSDCKGASKKMKLTLKISTIGYDAIIFNYNNKHACPGDSGGPALNYRGHVVGVASWSNLSNESTYRPTHENYAFIFNSPRKSGYPLSSWYDVQKKGINSHQQGVSWCQDGSFMTAIDLDKMSKASAHDSPVVGRARCTKAVNKWVECFWVNVQRGGINSHHNGPAWCQNGSFITALDLDGGKNYNAYDAPVVGSARCCKSGKTWGACFWVEIGAQRSHQSWLNWCPDGSYLTAIDLDRESKASAHDSPVVGRAMCCSEE